MLAAEPDGRNINHGCGSTHPAALAERVREAGAAIGFAFDGDGDRVVAVDSAGAVRDGDELIAIAAHHLAATGRLAGGVAVTVMSNYGFHQAMDEAGIEVATTAVGDRSVSAELEAREWTLGGEQSGHLIWTDFAPTGDGIAAALLTLAALGDRRLAEVRPIERLPQVLENVEVADRDAVDDAAAVWEAVEREAVRARGARPGAGPPVGHRAAGAGDGRGARGRRGRGGLRPAGRGRADRARLDEPPMQRRTRWIGAPERRYPDFPPNVRNRRICGPAPVP